MINVHPLIYAAGFFQYQRHNFHSFNRKVFDDTSENNFADLAVVFHCRTGTPSFVALHEIPTVHLFQPAGDQWALATDQRGWINGVTRIDKKLGYRKEIIHHEIGHAFGLGGALIRNSPCRSASSTNHPYIR